MNAVEQKSAATTVETSRSAPPDPMRNESLSEAEFLRKEAEVAKAAIAKTLEDLKADLVKAADLEMWTQKHPWAAVGVASLAGFLAASAVVPPKQDRHGRPAEEPRAERDGEQHRQEQPRNRSTAATSALNWLMVPAFDVIKRSVEHYVNSLVSGTDGNGRTQPEEAEAHQTEQPVG